MDAYEQYLDNHPSNPANYEDDAAHYQVEKHTRTHGITTVHPIEGFDDLDEARAYVLNLDVCLDSELYVATYFDNGEEDLEYFFWEDEVSRYVQ